METKNTRSKISVVIPNHNGSETLRRCLEAVELSSYLKYECIVVDDGSTDDSIEIAESLAAKVVVLEGRPLGPANARNVGVQAASGEIIFFIDADVVIYPDTLKKIALSFTNSSELAAVFGSYDDQPGDGHFLSQYKNLFHHFIHQQANENSGTFWSGCGAIRREIFLEIGGFDTLKYPRPSIEDIDLGRRLSNKGYKILINKSVQVKHLKRWTLTSLIKTDVFDRGIPWTQLVIADRKMPNELNLESSQRWSALLIGILLTTMTTSAFFYPQVILLPIILCLFWFMLQCWRWSGQLDQFGVDRSSFLKTISFLVIFFVLAFRMGLINFVPPMLVFLASVIAGPLLTKRSQFLRRAIFSLMISIIIVAILQIVMAYPLWLTAFLLFLLGVFIVFNRSFYAFFQQKRGSMFAIAVAPFHMLYFLYSMVAFALGTLIYYRKAGFPFLAKR